MAREKSSAVKKRFRKLESVPHPMKPFASHAMALHHWISEAPWEGRMVRLK
jgi:hypothetical protein